MSRTYLGPARLAKVSKRDLALTSTMVSSNNLAGLMSNPHLSESGKPFLLCMCPQRKWHVIAPHTLRALGPACVVIPGLVFRMQCWLNREVRWLLRVCLSECDMRKSFDSLHALVGCSLHAFAAVDDRGSPRSLPGVVPDQQESCRMTGAYSKPNRRLWCKLYIGLVVWR